MLWSVIRYLMCLRIHYDVITLWLPNLNKTYDFRIRSVLARLPEANSAREYEVYSPDTQEVYVFNRFGQHIATKNILTGETSYTFQYNVNTSNGKLSMVVDSAGNRVFILRNYASQVCIRGEFLITDLVSVFFLICEFSYLLNSWTV